jgi:RNA polymerase sigma factor (sigma-70 family)
MMGGPLMATAKIEPEIEAALIERVRGGEHEAFYELVRPHERGIYLAALSVLNNDADAEEVVQEAILKAFKALPRFRGDARFSTWIIQITVNEARMKLRKDRRHLYDSLDEARRGEDEGDYVPRDFADWREIPSEALETGATAPGPQAGARFSFSQVSSGAGAARCRASEYCGNREVAQDHRGGGEDTVVAGASDHA